MPRRMLEIGVEGDLFNEHDEDDQCIRAGCIPIKEKLGKKESPDMLFGLACGVCFFVTSGKVKNAITVVGGWAVCEDHVNYIDVGYTVARIKGISKETH